MTDSATGLPAPRDLTEPSFDITELYEETRSAIEEDPHQLIPTAVTGASVFAWYALPDFVRSKGVRALLKVGLLGVAGWAAWDRASDFDDRTDYYVAGEESYDETPDDADCDDTDEGDAELPIKELAIGAGLAAASIGVTVACEKWLFSRGERRRAQGVALAHTRQALPLTIGAILVDAAALVFLRSRD
ncbi:peptidase S9 [Schaalia sp. ZJ405]|uniref:peptidase S9 n=1 Tax=Schaalia sp. ZJ405 TaxID=2709403 RepID=UPI001E283309|nr:peptidase S9 [Schaalia sp. ZJ405]